MKSFIRGIKNIIKWLPIIWKDRDFDYGYLLDILQFKLKAMEEFFNSNDTWTKDAKKCAKQIMIVKNLVQRINHNDYIDSDTYQRMKYMQNQDLEYLGIILRKHLTSWWD